MPKQVTVRQIAARIAARRAASQAGANWPDLSKDQRKTYMEAGRKTMLPEDSKKAARKLAKKEAERTGSKWSEIPKEQRRELIKQTRARDKANK